MTTWKPPAQRCSNRSKKICVDTRAPDHEENSKIQHGLLRKRMYSCNGVKYMPSHLHSSRRQTIYIFLIVYLTENSSVTPAPVWNYPFSDNPLHKLWNTLGKCRIFCFRKCKSPVIVPQTGVIVNFFQNLYGLRKINS